MSGKSSAITVTLNLDASGFTSQITKANGMVLNLNTNIGTLNMNAKAATGAAEDLGGAFSAAAINTLIWVEALNTLKQTFIDLPEHILKTNAEIQKTQVMLQGLSRASDEAGRQQEAREQFQWILELGRTAPFSLGAIQDAFVKLKTVGIDPMNGSLQTLLDAVAKNGASEEKLRAASLAIQEMAGRGTVSLEQLRRQLGKAIPDAIQAMADSMNMTYGELMEAVEKGTLKSSAAIQGLLDQLSRLDQGQALLHMQNLTGIFAQVETSWIQLQNTIGESGFVQEVEKQLQDLVNVMNSSTGTQWAKQYGEQLGELVRDVRAAIDIFIQYRGAIEAVAGNLVLVVAISKTIEAVKGLGAALALNWVQASAQAAASSKALSTTLSLLRGEIVLTSAAETAGAVTAGVATVAMRALGAAFSVALGPIGMAAILIYQVADAMGVFNDASEKARQDIKDGLVTQETIAKLEDANEEINKQIELHKKLRDEYRQNSVPVTIGGKTFQDPRIADENERLGELMAQLNANSAAIIQARNTLSDRETDAFMQKTRENIQRELDDASNQYSAENQKIRALRDLPENKEGTPGRDAIKDQQAALQKAYYDKIEGILKAHIAEMQKLAETGDAQQQKQASAELAQLNKQLDATQQMADRQDAPAYVEKTSKGLSKIQQEIMHLEEVHDEAMAKMTGKGEEYAKVMVQLSTNKEFVGATEAEKQTLIDWANKVDDAKKKLEAWQETKRKDATAWQLITTKSTEAKEKLEEYDAQLMSSSRFKDPLGVIQLSAELERAKKNLDMTTRSVSDVDKAIVQAKSDALQMKLDEQFQKDAEAARKLNEDLAGNAKDVIEKRYQDEVDLQMNLLALDKHTGEERKKIEEDVYAYLHALREKANRDEENGFQQLAREWEDSSKQMGDAMKNWADDGTTAIAQFVTTGKLDMDSLTQQILQDIIKIEMQKALASSLGGAGDWVAQILGIGAAAAGAYDPNLGAPALNAPDLPSSDLTVPSFNIAHTGGLLGFDALESRAGIDPSVFNGAPRFHTGGLVGDEIPIIARRGEGVFTEGQMRAMGGGNMPAITVNVINQSGQQMDADQHKPRFDGESLILDVVLRAASRPGQFRSGMQGALKS